MTNDRALELAQAALFEQIHTDALGQRVNVDYHEAVDVIQKIRDRDQPSPLFGNNLRRAREAIKRLRNA